MASAGGTLTSARNMPSAAASSSAASTPSYAGSPPGDNQAADAGAGVGSRVLIRPNSNVQNTMASTMPGVATSNEARPLSMTSKEWIIPPRPKPGRKPATDTPPTRRKAQNRAAQRAFRERRAARIGELEEQLDEQKEEHDRVVEELHTRISYLETESQSLQDRCQWLENQLQQVRMSKGMTAEGWDNGSAMAASKMRSMNAPPLLQHGDPSTLRGASPPLPAKTRTQPFSVSEMISPPEDLNNSLVLGCGSCSPAGRCACAEEVLANNNLGMGCGDCGLGTRCKCIEESLSLGPASSQRRRPGSPSLVAGEEKRQKLDESTEMDFTGMFSSNRNEQPFRLQPQTSVIDSVEMRDSCGFCKDGTYCVCADTLGAGTGILPPPRLPAISTQTHTPPPSDNDVVPSSLPSPLEVTATGAIKLPRLSSTQRNRTSERPQRPAASSTCGPNGPGTCAQCLADPISGLFCRSLAANFERSGRPQGTAGGCCGQGGPGGCCKTKDSSSVMQPPSQKPSLSLSCADTYKTLASHRHFERAADEIGTWLPKLRAIPNKNVGEQTPAWLAPMEVEAASIMSVLKEFDVRFGRGE